MVLQIIYSTSNGTRPPHLQMKFFLHSDKRSQNTFVKLNAVPVLSEFRNE